LVARLHQPLDMTPTDGALLLDLMNSLDAGIVLCNSRLDEVVLANKSGASALAELGATGTALPEALVDAASDTASRFRALPVASERGRTFYVRTRPLERHQGVLLTVTASVTRSRDLADALRQQFNLSVQSLRIVELLREGHRNREIAQRLGLTEGTVRQYLSQIFAELGVDNRTALVALVDRIAS
jgi:DNA-binding NarL/FixJ family response regulator